MRSFEVCRANEKGALVSRHMPNILTARVVALFRNHSAVLNHETGEGQTDCK